LKEKEVELDFFSKLIRLVKRVKECVLRFMNNPLVPYDKNQTGMDLCTMKVNLNIWSRSIETAGVIPPVGI